MATNGFFPAVFLLIACAGCASIDQPGEPVLSVAELVGRSSDFDDEHVSVQGWIEIEPETFRIWGTAEAMESGHDENQCVGIALPSGIDRGRLDRSEVIARGRYVSDVSGRFIVLGGCRARRFLLAEHIQLVR